MAENEKNYDRFYKIYKVRTIASQTQYQESGIAAAPFVGPTQDVSGSPMRNWTLVVNSVVPPAAPSAFSFDFDGVDDKVTSGTITFPGDNYSYSLWMKTANLAQGVGCLMDVGSSDDHMLYISGSNIIASDYSSGGSSSTTAVGFISASTWHHIALVRKSSDLTLKIYIDGVLRSTGVLAGATATYLPGSPFYSIGTRLTYGAFYDGLIADPRVYARAISAAEAATLSTGGTISSTNLDLWWKGIEGAGVSAADYSGNSYAGTLAGGALWDADFPPLLVTAPTLPLWEVILEGSLDGITFSEIMKHTSLIGLGENLYSGTTIFPILYYRIRCPYLVLGSSTDISALVLGTQ